MLESAMLQDINDSYGHRYLPYLQLHEFEGLLFNDIEIFYEQIPSDELIGKKELKQAFDNFENPEMINDTKENSPSHRLMRIINGYNKVVYGNILAEAIGLENIRSKCYRFNQWLEKIENL